MDELYEYMRNRLAEMQENRKTTVEIDCVEFVRLMKMVCYMRQIKNIVNDDI